MLARRGNYLTQLRHKANEIWNKAPEFQGLTPEELLAKSNELRSQAQGGEPLAKLLPRAYALVCEVARCALAINHVYDEQIMGAIALHEGVIIEMQNGEGKTLTATMPAYLNSLTKQHVHIATDNDYLASRDAKWMGPIYTMLGLTVGVLKTDASSSEHRTAYACDITYGANIDFVMDYLSDNLVTAERDTLIGDHLDYIILDEADSVLIDYARTPVRKSVPINCDEDWYRSLLQVSQELKPSVDYDGQTFELTDQGFIYAEKLLKAKGVLANESHLYNTKSAGVADHLLKALYALHRYKRDRDYIVKDGFIMPVDSINGRLQEHNSFSNGIHQAIQAKEHVFITPENTILAEISYQHFFKLYNKMAGMTATAKERAPEFLDVYEKQIVEIPPRQRSQRIDRADYIYRNDAGRLYGVIEEIEEIHGLGRPVLVNTQTIEAADDLGTLLDAKDITANILHAKYHEQEAAIIAKAGRRGAVTVAAKMAGRGTDILIDDDVTELGGLHVIGVERNVSRYMDRQLIGRAGRQGKPGTSRFFISLEDELMRRFAADRVAGIMETVGMDEDVPLDSGLVSRFIERGQGNIENANYVQRQHAYEFDSVLDKQRKLVYAIRRKAILQEDLSQDIQVIIENVVVRCMEKYLAKKNKRKSWDLKGLIDFFGEISPRHFPAHSFGDMRNRDWNTIKSWLIKKVTTEYENSKKKVQALSPEDTQLVQRERTILLNLIDTTWQKHLAHLQELQDDLFLRTQMEENRLEWYAQESYKAFWSTLEAIEIDFLKSMFAVSILPGAVVHDMA